MEYTPGIFEVRIPMVDKPLFGTFPAVCDKKDGSTTYQKTYYYYIFLEYGS